MAMKSRRERRAEARKKGVPFVPHYNGGIVPMTHYEMYGVGYERFNSKYVTIVDVKGEVLS